MAFSGKRSIPDRDHINLIEMSFKFSPAAAATSATALSTRMSLPCYHRQRPDSPSIECSSLTDSSTMEETARLRIKWLTSSFPSRSKKDMTSRLPLFFHLYLKRKLAACDTRWTTEGHVQYMPTWYMCNTVQDSVYCTVCMRIGLECMRALQIAEITCTLN